VIFGFGRRNDDDDDDDDDDEEEMDFVLFQGALNGKNPDLSENTRLVQAGLVPAKRLVTEALSRRAEMIRLEPKGKVATASFFVDGVAYPGDRMPAPAGMAITQMLKLLAGLDIKEKTKPQAGGIKAEYDETPYEIRINTQPIKGGGERLIVRARNTNVQMETPKDLGFSDALVEKIRAIGSSKSGLILAAGSPFSGVTTVSLAIVRAIDAYLYSIFCLADLEGRDLAHINMFKWNEGDDFERTIQRAKRSDADVMYVDPLKTKEDARVVLENAGESAFIAEMPAKDAADAIARLCQLVGDPKLVAEHLKLIMSQKLIRLLCTKCRQAFRPNPKLLAKVGLPPETNVLYRPPRPDEDEEEDEEDICPKCGGIGYYGRTGLMEVIEMTEGIKKIVLAGADPQAIRAQVRKEKMQSFQSDGMRVVAEGKTSLEELQRAFRSQG
jgi:type II secretory ATPase GspE/PulE/Tfp pilus assembly ATPase PilB-like protein